MKTVTNYPRNMVSLLHARSSDEQLIKHLPALLQGLPVGFVNSVENYGQASDYHAHLVGRLLLYHALGSSELDLNFGTFGKPYFSNGPYFNISHKKDMVICAVSHSGPVGVDVEYRQVLSLEHYQSILNPEELSLAERGADIDLLDVWVKKESICKAIGRGLDIAMEDIYLKQSVGRVKGEAKSWHLRKVDLSPEFITYLCSSSPITKIQNFLKSHPCNGFIIKFPIISPVGQYLTARFPFSC